MTAGTMTNGAMTTIDEAMRKSILYLSIVAVLAASCAVREEAGAPDTDAARTIQFVADTQSEETPTAIAPGEDRV